jgi:uncharacterized repeat protein (TIGR01451 family)
MYGGRAKNELPMSARFSLPRTLFYRGVGLALLIVLWTVEMACLQAGIAWTPTGQPSNIQLNLPSDPTLAWIAGADNLLSNGSFEQGITNGWTVDTIRGAGYTANYAGAPGLTNVPVLEGAFSACLSGKSPSGSESTLWQEVALPAEASSVVLSWLVWVDDGSSTYTRELRLEVRDLANQVLAVAFRGDQNRLPFRQTYRYTADLSSFAGRTVRLAFVGKIGSQARLELDDLRLMSAPMPGVQFEVYLAESTNPVATNLLGQTADLRWPFSGLKPAKTYYWQVIAVRGSERTPGPVWRFSTGGRSTLEHYSFAAVPSPQVLGQSVSLEISARDVLDFSPSDAPAAGTAALDVAALAEGITTPGVLISELLVATGYGTTNSVECANVSTQTVDVSGWQLALYDDIAYRTPRVLFTVPANSSVGPGGVFVLRSYGKAPGAFPNFCTGAGVNWNASGGRVGVALLDAATNLVDFVNGYGVEAATVTNPVPVGLDHWLGTNIGPASTTSPAYQRVGQVDQHGANNWILTTNSLGRWNAGLQAVFLPGRGKLPITPQRFTNSLAGVWTGATTFLGAGGTNVLLCARDAKGHSGQSTLFDVKALPLVFLELPSLLREGQILATNAGLARLRQVLETNVTIQLAAAPTGELSLPASVLIPAGALTADFPVQAQDDALLDGPARVNITGQAEEFEVMPAETVVLDHETCVLKLGLPSEVPEGATRLATLSISAPLPRALVVSLRSSDSTAIQTPSTLTLPPGVTNASFVLSAPEDGILTGPQTVQVTAEVAGWPPVTGSVGAVDNEVPTLEVSLPGRLAEGAGTTNAGTIRLTGQANTDLLVSLASDDESELTVPTNILVRAGQSSASFPVTVVDDAEQDGTQWVHVRATAPGFTPGLATIAIADNEPHSFSVEVSSDPKFAGVSFAVTVTAFDVNGELVPAFTTAVPLSARGSGGPLRLAPQTTGGFANGRWSGRVTIQEVDDAARIAVAWPGASGESPSFRLLPNPIRYSLPLFVADLIWNPVSQRLLASVAEIDPYHPNSVVTINPQTGTIENALPVGQIQRVWPGDNPGEGRLALSADGQTLYIATGGATNIQQFNLATGALVRQFAVGTNDDGGVTVAYDLQVVPTNSQRIVIARPDTYDNGSLGVYDSGVLLPGRGPWSSRVMLAPDGSGGFSYMGLSLGDTLFRYQLTPNGVAGAEMLPKSSFWYGGDVRLNLGRIYFSSGDVYDPQARAWAGRYPVTGLVTRYDNQGSLEFSADGQWVWFISGDGLGGQSMEVFVRDSFQLARRLDLTTIPGTIFRLWQCGPDRLALHNTFGVYILQSSLLLPMGEFADLAMGYRVLSPCAVTGQPFTYLVTVTNLGPATAQDVILDDALPIGVECTAATVTQGRWESRGNGGRAAFGDLATGAIANATITVTPRQGGWFTNDLLLCANQWDPVPENSRLRPVISTRLGLGRNDYAILPVGARALAYDPTQRRLYASISNTGGAWADRVLVIEAATGEIVDALDVGRGPNRLAVSDDAHYLYASIEDDLAVRRFDLRTRQPDLYFVLGRTSDNQLLSVVQLQAVPRQPASVAILLRETLEGTGSGGAGIAIYDNAARRPQAGLDLSFVAASFFRFNEDGTSIYGANMGNGGLECLAVTPQGTTMTRRVFGLIGNSGTLSLDYANGRLYTSDGRIIDPAGSNVVSVAVQNGDQRAVFHPAAGRACYVRWPGAVLDVFDAATRAPVGTLPLSSMDDFIDDFLPMVEDRLALRLYKGDVYLVRSSLLLPADWDADGDGMPDVWELGHGLNPDVADAAEDADHDGATNFTEYTAGTDPQNPASAPELTLTRLPLGSLELRICSAAGRHYRLDRRSAVGTGAWMPAADERVGDGTDIVFSIPAPIVAPEFYRVCIYR